MSAPEDLLPLIRRDGEAFVSAEIAALTQTLDALENDDRVRARNRNSDAIARDDSRRLLLVSGPGTGKSTLFKARLQHWLVQHPGQRVWVATFVRKLVRDLTEDIAGDESIGADAKKLVSVMTLHGLARSIVETTHGTHAVPLAPHCLVVTRAWEEVVWRDAVSLQGKHRLETVPWEELLAHLYDGEPPSDATWAALRTQHVNLEQYYNALVFADLILFGAQAAIENPEVVADTLFIIDEFQDFNLGEDAFIRAVTHESLAVLFAGDDDQVLYDTLRRGHPSIIRGYYNDGAFANAMLPYCGRCSVHIGGAAAAFLAADKPAASIDKVFLPLVVDPAADLVTVVASTSPKAGVQYVEWFLREHEDRIRERHEALAGGLEKDAYLLILTPAREMNFLNVGGARERLKEAIREYAPEDQRPSADYWIVRDYYYAAAVPTQNYNIRKALSYQGVDQEVVTSLLHEGLGTGKCLSEIDHEAIRSCLETSAAVGAILASEGEPEEQVAALAALGIVSDADTLARDLRLRPIGSGSASEGDDPDLGQNERVAAVDVTTIVGAKGLSADHVIVVGCDDVNMDWVSRNAFFVAMTRARKSLTLMACIGGGGATVLHPFVCALPDQHTRAVYAKADGAHDVDTISALQDRLQKWAYAKSRR